MFEFADRIVFAVLAAGDDTPAGGGGIFAPIADRILVIVAGLEPLIVALGLAGAVVSILGGIWAQITGGGGIGRAITGFFACAMLVVAALSADTIWAALVGTA